MPPRKNGLRRSSATTFRRRLIIFRRLFRSDCSASELIESVNLALNHDGYPPAATMALKHDLDALKHEYNCVIRFDRKTNCYKLLGVGDFAILDLPSESLDALNFIDKNRKALEIKLAVLTDKDPLVYALAEETKSDSLTSKPTKALGTNSLFSLADSSHYYVIIDVANGGANLSSSRFGIGVLSYNSSLSSI
jgi:hypothetical protein